MKKYIFIGAITVPLLLFYLFLAFFRQIEFMGCSEGNFKNTFKCPANEKHIIQKNIIFVDVTDKFPDGKRQDLSNLIFAFASQKQDFWDWVFNGVRVEKTSVYILTDQETVAMEPIAVFCSLPPDFALRLLPAHKRSDQKTIKKNIEVIISKISSKGAANHSHIVNGLAAVTSNASYWESGGKLVLFSDLYENSATCGYFENGRIVAFDAISPECKAQVDILRRGLQKRADGGSKKNSTVAICQILSKEQHTNLPIFWQQLFRSSVGYDPLFACDPNEIRALEKRLNYKK